MRLRLGVVATGAALMCSGAADGGSTAGNGRLAWATSKLPPTGTVRIGTPGGTARTLAIGAHPDPSPDGKRVAFDGGIGGSGHAYTATTTGGDRRDLGPGVAPRWSPDGSRLLLYVESAGYTKHFFTVSAEGKERRSLGVAGSAAWSPDGKRIAVAAKRLTVVDAATGRVQADLGEGSDPVWSPDGTRIAFDRNDEIEGWQIYVTALDGSAPVQVGLAGEVSGPYVEWAPDSRRLVFNTDFDEQPGEELGRALMVVDVVTHKTKEVRTESKVYAPTWSPNGRQIAYSLDHNEPRENIGPPGVAVVNADGTGRTEIAEGELPAWSRDGARLALAESYGVAHGVVTIRPNGRDRRLLPVPASRGVDGPRWVGRSLVWSDYPEGSLSEVFTSGASGSAAAVVSPDYTDFDPAWSPSGRMLAVVEEVTTNPDVPSLQDVIAVERADGSGRRQLTSGLAPTWSPGGRLLAFVHGRVLYVIRVAGGKPHRIAGTRGARSPAWSADGRRIAYQQGKFVFEVSPDGRARRRIAAGQTPAFAPDGKRLAFGRGSALYLIGSSGGTPRWLTRVAVKHPAWSPDGRFIAGDGGVVVTVATGAVRTIAALKQARAVDLDWQRR